MKQKQNLKKKVDKIGVIILISLISAGQFFVMPKKAGAITETYYVDATNGSDANTGTDTSHPWQTIAKVNSSVFQPGDSVLFKRGETWRETLIPPSSGTSGDVISFGAYGSGTNPVITGANLISSSWTQATEPYDIVLQRTSGVDSSNFPRLTGESGGTTYPDGIVTRFNSTDGTWGNPFDGDLYFKTYDDSSAVVDQQALSNFPFLNLSNVASQTKWSQGYKPSVNFSLSQIVLKMYKSGNPTDNVFVTINKDENQAPGAVIPNGQSSNVSSTTLTSTSPGTDVTFTFPVAPSLVHDAVTNVWQTTVATQPEVVEFDGVFGNKKTSVDDLAQANDWYWSGNTLYVYSTTDPAVTYANPGIEIAQRNYALDFNAKSNLAFQDIDFVAGNTYDIFMEGTATDILFDSVGIYGAYEEGINHQSAFHASNIDIQNSTVAYNGAEGIAAVGNSDHWIIQNNIVHNNGYTDESGGVENTWGSGIKLVGAIGGITVSDSIVQYNDVYYNGYKDNGITRVHATANKGFGIWLDLVDSGDVQSDGNIIRYNNVHNNADSGLMIEKSRYQTWYGNVSYNNAEYGLRVDADANGPVLHNNFFYNNSFFGNSSGIYAAGGYMQDGNYIQDNVFENNISSGNTNYQLLAKWGGNNDGTLGSGNIYEYNSFGPESPNFIEWGDGVFKSTYAQFDAAYGADTHSASGDPSFAAAGSANFALSSVSPAIDSGLNLDSVFQAGLAAGSVWPSSVTTLSQDGNGSGWDLGAFVYTQSTLPLVSITNPNTTNISGKLTISASVTVSQPATISQVQFQLDGSDLGSPVTSAPYSMALDTTTLINGSHTINATALDNFGNTGSSTITAFVSNGGSGLPASAFNPPVIPDGGFKVIINNGDTSTTAQTVTLDMNAGSDVARMAVSNSSDLDSAGQQTYAPDTTWDLCAGFSSCDAGLKTVYVKFYTSYGHASDLISASINFTATGSGQATSVNSNLVNDNGTYYLIQNGQRLGITSPGILFTYGYEFKDARGYSPADANIPLGPLLTPDNGSLVKSDKNPTVYLISQNQKHGFVSEEVFLGLGYKFSSVLTVTDPELARLSNGLDLATDQASHMDGINVLDNRGTIYYIDHQTLRAYPSQDIYNSWHLDNNFSNVVAANAYDLALPRVKDIDFRQSN
ncbi:MAG TPA: Ig-like domain-containing protein [Patescibacteria group bacterium]|nr:Ig-like domain-containing protein [Patescibacteria group bacterium]